MIRTNPQVPETFALHRAFGDVPACARELARELDPRVASRFVAEKAVEIAFPERVRDPLFHEVIHRSTLDNVDLMWRVIAGRASLDGAAPAGALAFAEAAAELGVQVSQFERVYRVGIGLVWIAWYREAVRYAERTGAPLGDLVAAPTLIIHAYIDILLGPMLARYDATGAAARRTSEQLRRSILRQALDGTPVLAEDDAVQALGVAPDAEFLAFAAHGPQIDLDDLAEYARASAGATHALGYRHGPDHQVIWLVHESGFTADGRELLHGALERSGARIAVSDPTRGTDAIGTSGRDALETSRLQTLIGDDGPVLHHADVRLESLLFSDPERARRFVRTELRGLDEDSHRMAVLRDTAMVWLSTGSNVATAARLGLHEHTVRNRVAQADDLAGQALATRRTEILVALRLRRILEGEAAEA
jgi:hypothetical protein